MNQIVFCTDGIFPYLVGGMQRHSRLLIEELSKRSSLIIHVIHPHPEIIFNKSNIIEHRIIPIDVKRNYILESYKYSKRVYAIIRSLNANLPIYSQGLSVWYGASTLKSRLIINPHGLEPFQARKIKDRFYAFFFKRIFLKLFNNAAHVISLGGNLTQILNNYKIKGVIEIPNGVNLPATESTVSFPNTDLPIKFIFVSRFVFNKGIADLVNVIDKLNKSGYSDKLFFNLVGNGPLYLETLNKTKSMKNVKLHGNVSDDELNLLYQESHVFILPTHFEGMPTVVLEAMARKLPIIVSNTGATKTMVSKENGYIINPGNETELYNVILEFYQLPIEKKVLLSKHSFERVKNNFTWEKVARIHEDLFSTINN